MFSVGIIVPTWHYFANPFKLQPLNELYLATVIDSRFEGRDARVNVIDLREGRDTESEIDIKNVAAHIPEHSVYFYWIAKTADYLEIVSVVEQLRRSYPKARHAAGGTHVEVFPDMCKKHFDAIVLGPGEESCINIINDHRHDSLKKVYRTDWKDVDYDNYPFARRHYLPEDSIINTVLFEKYGGKPGTSAMFSRGCNFKCAYCVYNVPGFIQRRSPENVEKEINYLKDTYKITAVNLRDEICIPLSPREAIPFMESIGRTNVTWRGQTRIGASREIIKLASESGCVELALGIESASQTVLNIIKKRQSEKQIREFIQACKSFNIKVKMCLILGLPGEPKDIVSSTRSLIDETKPDYVNISGFCPVPGSEIFKNQERYGIKHIDDDWSRHAHLLYRFSDEEDFGLPFEYNETADWGSTFSRNEIIENIKELQHYVRERGMIY
jgi:radical SAM superfamily enzyme YgiQ (UPF0313 family)